MEGAALAHSRAARIRCIVDIGPELVDLLRVRIVQSATDHGSAQLSSEVASVAELDAAERTLGYRIPPPVRFVYSNVANGGFGPGYGLVGIGGGMTGFMNGTRRWHCEDEYVSQLQQDGFRWPEGVLPICDWGCAIFSCVDCSSPDARISRAFLDAMVDGLPDPIRPEGYGFVDWLVAWANGVDLWTEVLDRLADQ